MGLVDRILGRRHDLEDERAATPAAEPAEPPAPGAPATPADAEAVAEYERLLRTAPADTIEKVHVEAFEKLTPEQLDILYDRFTAAADTPAERPADSSPTTLATSAAELEQRRPGALQRVLGDDRDSANLTSLVGLSILDTVIWYTIASTLWTSFDDGGGADAVAGDADASPGAPDDYDDPPSDLDGFGGGFDF